MTDPTETDHRTAEAAYMAGEHDRAAAIWTRLAEAGDATAEAWLGTLYSNGEGVERDDAAALGWLRRAAEQGVVTAQANLGAFLYLGRGAESDPAEAARWLDRAAEAGDVHALFNLAVLCLKGEGVPASPERAAELYRRAAERGHHPSQARLGYLYSAGQGVEKDRVQAYLWLTLAAQHGVGTAFEALDGVVRAMSADEKAEGMRLFEQAMHSGVGRQPVTAQVVPVPA